MTLSLSRQYGVSTLCFNVRICQHVDENNGIVTILHNLNPDCLLVKFGSITLFIYSNNFAKEYLFIKLCPFPLPKASSRVGEGNKTLNERGSGNPHVEAG
jgi:hypothetical protein